MQYLPLFLGLIFSASLFAEDECPNNSSPSACMECADDSYSDALAEIRAEEKKMREAAIAAAKSEVEIETIFDRAMAKRMSAGETMMATKKKCDNIVVTPIKPKKK